MASSQVLTAGVADTRLALADVPYIDKNIIYRDFENNSSPYTYVMKVLDLNRERIQDMFGIIVAIDYDSKAIHFRGDSNESVVAAIQRTVQMLKEPVYNLRVDPAFVVALRILKEVKKDFSAQTGCWLHFIWVSRTVSCYGVDGAAASQYLSNVIEVVRRCIKAPKGYNGCIVTERQCDRRYKNLLKRYVDYIEAESGAKMAIKKDDLPSGTLTLQFYGTVVNINSAMDVLASNIFSNPPDKAAAPTNRRAADAPVPQSNFAETLQAQIFSGAWPSFATDGQGGLAPSLAPTEQGPPPVEPVTPIPEPDDITSTPQGLGDEESLALQLLSALRERPDVKFPTIASFIRQSGVEINWVVQLLQLLKDLNVSLPQAISYLSNC
eukprot:TRINITY_DN1005_c0_g1_i1.p1 TRINITY_DN1005_c0_g1~~TRINITY_DN1005_c0_g1_i1.p1  ORF type:complete len:381 (-),score=64.01 TRINITY_DN1005_c0_g1_i1:113-1255(-)